MITAVIKETGQGGGGSTAVLQLITRCLEVTPVYTHTRSLTHRTVSPWWVRRNTKSRYIHVDWFWVLIVLCHSFLTWKWREHWRETKTLCCQFFTSLSKNEEKSSSKTQSCLFFCQDKNMIYSFFGWQRCHINSINKHWLIEFNTSIRLKWYLTVVND